MVHAPVLTEEVLRYLRCRPDGLYVDVTVGTGGHAQRILEASSPAGRLIALDQDPACLDEARRRLRVFGDRVAFYHENFRRLGTVLERAGISRVDGILADLGVSSFQLGCADRGFSFQLEGPLDMRMNRSTGFTAADLVNTASESTLRRIFSEYGEERWANRIARAIGRARAAAPIRTTTQLVSIIIKAVPRSYRFRKIHPATRVFQALRIAVNDELNALNDSIPMLVDHLAPNGRLVAISFHSLEDRIVKQRFRLLERQGAGKVVTKKPVTPAKHEQAVNPRSRSAKLRVFERV